MEHTRIAHNQAVALGALRVFCATVYKHMCVINAIVHTDSVEQLFSMGAKYEMMRDGSNVLNLEHVVTEVCTSSDGSPDMDPTYHDAVRDIMEDYHHAHAAVLAGTHAVKQYSRGVMLPAIMDVSSIEGQTIADEDAESYMQRVEQCCMQFDMQRRTGPLFDMLAQALH